MPGGKRCVCVFVWRHAACVRQTALFEVAGTGGLTAWQAPAGYWPTDGTEGGVCRGLHRGGCRGGVLEERRGAWPVLDGDPLGVATGTVKAVFLQSAQSEQCNIQ